MISNKFQKIVLVSLAISFLFCFLISCNKSDTKSKPAPQAQKIDVSSLKDPGKSFEQSCKDGDLEAIQYYIETGKGSIAQSFEYAKTPLHWAVASKHPEAVSYLLSKGAAVNQPDDDQFTPLHVNAMWGDSVTTKLLVKAGAILYARDNNKMNPLDLAAMKANKETALALIQSGSDINDENENKWTALRVADYAKKTLLDSSADDSTKKAQTSKIDDFMAFLRAHGATK